MVNYDEIGAILLKYCSFRAAEALIEQLRAMIEEGRHPGAACLSVLDSCPAREWIFAEEPIKGWLAEHQAGQAASAESPFAALPWVQEPLPAWLENVAARGEKLLKQAEPPSGMNEPFAVPRIFGRSVVENLTIMREDTRHYRVAAKREPSGEVWLDIAHQTYGCPSLLLSKSDALELMVALATGLALMEKLK